MKLEGQHDESRSFFSHLVHVLKSPHLRVTYFLSLLLTEQYAPDLVMLYLSTDLLDKHFPLVEAQV